MLKIDISKIGRMGADGRQILRSLQNTHTNEMDLYIRETIQNSLDAGLVGKNVNVDFTIKSFSAKQLFSKLEGTEQFSSYFDLTQDYDYIMVSDKNTTGLDGPLSHDYPKWKNNSENLLKLVYDIGKAQTGEGAGGSWGYGKSIHYRIGVGLVIYYSRVKNEENQLEDRLAVCLVENQLEDDTFIPYDDKNRTGIVWWGEYIEELDATIPVLERSRIIDFLKIFNTTPYNDNETGTKVIVPFINQDDIMSTIKDGPSSIKPNFYDDISEYLKYSVQRWYAPRLNNEKYKYGKKSNLLVSINDEYITIEDQEHFFNIIREMYNHALNEHDKGIFDYLDQGTVIHKKVAIINHQREKLSLPLVGNFVYALINYKDLKMSDMYDYNNPNFLTNLLTGVEDLNVANKPIVLFTRQPGMIVNYVNVGDWVPSTIDRSLEEYVVGFFVLNSDVNAYFETLNGNLTIEQYVRGAERSDHIDWFDSNFISVDKQNVDPKIVSKIKNNITRTLHGAFSEKNTGPVRIDDVIQNHLSSLLGKMIMPQGFGSGASPTQPLGGDDDGKGPKVRTRKKGNSKIILKQDETTFDQNKIIVPFNIEILKDCRLDFEVNLYIVGDKPKVELKEFENDFEIPSYIQIAKIEIKKELETYFEFEEKITEKFGSLYSVRICSKMGSLEEGEMIDGNIVIETKDKSIVPNIEIKEVIKDE